MYDECSIFRDALEELCDWGVHSVYIRLNKKFDWVDENIDSIYTQVSFTKQKEILEKTHVVQRGLEHAAQEILKLSGTQLDVYRKPFFDLTANLRSGVFEYRGYEELNESLALQHTHRSWPLEDGTFFKEIQFRPSGYAVLQTDVLETWRPHPATSLKFEWQEDTTGVFITGNENSLYYDAIWPACVPKAARALRENLNTACPPPEQINPRSIWHQRLTVDFEKKIIQFMQIEILELQNEFSSGIMPLKELVWLATSPEIPIPLSEEEHFAWKTNGIFQRVITTEELVANVGIFEPRCESILTQFPKSYDQSYSEESNIINERPDWNDEQELLNEEIYDSQEAAFRCEEEGWYYND